MHALNSSSWEAELGGSLVNLRPALRTFQVAQGYTVAFIVWLWIRHTLCGVKFYWLSEAVYNIIELVCKGFLRLCLAVTFIIGAQEMLAVHHAINSILSVPSLGCTSESCSWLSLGKVGDEWMRLCTFLSEESLPNAIFSFAMVGTALSHSRKSGRGGFFSFRKVLHALYLHDGLLVME